MNGRWIASWLGAAIVCWAGIGAADAGAPRCDTSDTCVAPTPHCHPSLRECVQCLSSRNCPRELACDEATGTCVSCTSDGDCSSHRPYCVGSRCVECRTESNCRTPGVACGNGRCGVCGDGICSTGERLVNSASWRPAGAIELELCPEDCESLLECNTLSLGAIRTLSVGEKDLFESNCALSFPTPDVAVTFTADVERTYYLTVRPLTEVEFLVVSLSVEGQCPGTHMRGCNYYPGGDVRGYAVELPKGASVTFVIESPVSARLEVGVTTQRPCEGVECEPGSEAGIPSDQGKTRCLQGAANRGDEMCAGVTCACSHCPRDYDLCAVIPGCDRIDDCLRGTGCVGEDCYASGACARVIDANGGPEGPAFHAASALQSCTLQFSCNLPCTDSGRVAEPDAAVPACTADAARPCTCADGGAGNQRCNDEGTAFGDCRCVTSAVQGPARASDSNCDCGLAHRSQAGPGLAALVALAAVAGGRKARRKGRTAP